VFTLAEEVGGRYARAFTWANYWFRDKTTYFGDWVVVEGADSLSAYYAAMARAVDALADKWKRDKGYVPQAYPQIARAAIAGIKAKLMATWRVGSLAWGFINAAVATHDTWRSSGDVRHGAVCGIWLGTFSLFGWSIAEEVGGWTGRIVGWGISWGMGGAWASHFGYCRGGIINRLLNWWWNR